MTKAGKRIHDVTAAILADDGIAIGTIHRDFGDTHYIYAGYGEWLLCDGSKVYPELYPELYALCAENWAGCVPNFEP